MFSKHLEDLIQATLQDGILEDYEKEALLKAAKAEGVDPNELQIYINSILQKRAQEKKAKKDRDDMILERERIAAKGKVCPNCGRQVPPLTLKCVCGYEFTDQKSASSVSLLSKEIDEIMKNSRDDDKRDEKIRNVIKMFPVPNTKEDIIEFLALAAPNSKHMGGKFGTVADRVKIIMLASVAVSIIVDIIYFIIEFNRRGHLTSDAEAGLLVIPALTIMIAGMISAMVAPDMDKETLRWNKNAVVWRAKFEQVLMKGRSLQGDPDFQRQLDYYENVVNEK